MCRWRQHINGAACGPPKIFCEILTAVDAKVWFPFPKRVDGVSFEDAYLYGHLNNNAFLGSLCRSYRVKT